MISYGRCLLSGEFIRKLQKCNPSFRVFCHGKSTRAAGLWKTDDVLGDDVDIICGIDKNFVPEHLYYDEGQHIVKRGWRKTLDILIKMKHIRRGIAERVFETHLSTERTLAFPTYTEIKDDLHTQIDKLSRYNKDHKSGREENVVLSSDEIVGISEEIHKEMEV